MEALGIESITFNMNAFYVNYIRRRHDNNLTTRMWGARLNRKWLHCFDICGASDRNRESLANKFYKEKSSEFQEFYIYIIKS